MIATSSLCPPVASSPLSPRSANIHGRPFRPTFLMPSSPSEPLPPPHEQAKAGAPIVAFPLRREPEDLENRLPIPAARPSSDFHQRPIKKAPSPKQEELKERRRKVYLQNVRDRRDERRFEARGDDMMRRDFLKERWAWEEELARLAPALQEEEGEEDGDETAVVEGGWWDLPGSSAMEMSTVGSQVPVSQDAEVEEVLRRENEELEALLALMPHEERYKEEHPWSDDDDYDALFSELMMQQAEEGRDEHQQRDEEAMDLS